MALKDWKMVRGKSKIYHPLFVNKIIVGGLKQEIGVAKTSDAYGAMYEVDFFNIPEKTYNLFATREMAIAYATKFMHEHTGR